MGDRDGVVVDVRLAQVARGEVGGLVRVVRGDGVADLVVLVHDDVPLDARGQHREPAEALVVDVAHVEPVPERRAVGDDEEGLVHEVVRLEERELVGGHDGLLLLSDDGVDAGDVSLRGLGAALDDDLPLEALAGEARVLARAHVDLRDVGPALGHRAHEPLLLEEHERLANGGAAEAELLAQALGDEALPGLVAREHERAPQGLVGLCLQGGGVLLVHARPSRLSLACC